MPFALDGASSSSLDDVSASPQAVYAPPFAPLAAAALGRAGYSELASELDALPSGGMEMRADDFLRIMEELRTGILAVLEQDRPDVALPVGSS